VTESSHAVSFGFDIIIMASAGRVELAVGAAAIERRCTVASVGDVGQIATLCVLESADLRPDSCTQFQVDPGERDAPTTTQAGQSGAPATADPLL
jgi:hypothetical protein